MLEEYCFHLVPEADAYVFVTLEHYIAFTVMATIVGLSVNGKRLSRLRSTDEMRDRLKSTVLQYLRAYSEIGLEALRDDEFPLLLHAYSKTLMFFNG